MQTITLYVGLDVHKDSITIAIAEPGPKGDVRTFGTISNSTQALERTLIRCRQAHPFEHPRQLMTYLGLITPHPDGTGRRARYR